MTDLSRRVFLKATTAAAATPIAVASASAATPHAHPSPPGGSAAGANAPTNAKVRMFFNPQEEAIIAAAVERLIPPDDVGPSALEAGVVDYLDNQLAGAWGAGERLYRGGPWLTGTPTQGYQLPLTPAELFRTALRGMRQNLQSSGGLSFEQMPGPDQDAYLTALQTEARDLDGVPSNVFFESLLAMTIEGYFGDPVYGGNKDMAAWRMIGFPGAYGAYYDLVDQHGVAFHGEPRSLGQDRPGHMHKPFESSAMPPLSGTATPVDVGRRVIAINEVRR